MFYGHKMRCSAHSTVRREPTRGSFEITFKKCSSSVEKLRQLLSMGRVVVNKKSCCQLDEVLIRRVVVNKKSRIRKTRTQYIKVMSGGVRTVNCLIRSVPSSFTLKAYYSFKRLKEEPKLKVLPRFVLNVCLSTTPSILCLCW